MPFDFIGDVHGHAGALKRLLEKLGYRLKDGVYSHPSRKVFFLGDYIDRGPEIRETLSIVKSMVEAGTAKAIMGNHEYNIVCYHTPSPEGGFLRKRTTKNTRQIKETLEQFEAFPEEWLSYLDWFKTLPVYYDGGNFRAVHAAWQPAAISVLDGNILASNEQWIESAGSDSKLYEAVELLLKGVEVALPNNGFFFDKDGNKRIKTRIKWWLNPGDKSIGEMSLVPLPKVGEEPFQSDGFYFYGKEEVPVFFGHYWMKGNPELQTGNSCCLDFSIAKGGVLAAYRFDGEERLDSRKLVWV